MIPKIHTGNPNTCFIRGPKFIQDRTTREYAEQYNLKNGCLPKHVSFDSIHEKDVPINPTMPMINSTNDVSITPQSEDCQHHSSPISHDECNEDFKDDVYGMPTYNDGTTQDSMEHNIPSPIHNTMTVDNINNFSDETNFIDSPDMLYETIS